MLGVC
jgi:hypothetical protein